MDARTRILVVLALVAIPLASDRDEPSHAVVRTNADVPGELIVVRDADDDGKDELWLIAADGSEGRRISDEESFFGVALSPDGETIAAGRPAQNDQMIVLVDVASGVLTQVAVPQGSYSGPTWSPTGEALAFQGVAYERLRSGFTADLVYIADATGTDARLLRDAPPDGASSPTWSPDGTRLAYTLRKIVVATADGARSDAITTGMQSIFAPVWSPVDDRIAFTGYENEFAAVYLINADGTGQMKLSPEAIQASGPAWSPDGQWIAFSSFDRGRTRLNITRADGSEHRAIDPGKHISDLRWSPDGAWIAFTTAIMESDGPLETVHLSVIDPFADDPDAHTLLHDLSDTSAPAWR